MRINDNEFYALSKLISHMKLDGEFDICGDDFGNDFFLDYEDMRPKPLGWGLELLEECIAYPLKHEGLTMEECDAIVELFKRFNIGNEDYYKWLLVEED